MFLKTKTKCLLILVLALHIFKAKPVQTQTTPSETVITKVEETFGTKIAVTTAATKMEVPGILTPATENSESFPPNLLTTDENFDPHPPYETTPGSTVHQDVTDNRGKKLPEGLEFLFPQVNEEQALHTEHCMDDLVECMKFHMKIPICAMSTDTDTCKTFTSLCDIQYINCKSLKIKWRYFSDGPCNNEPQPGPRPGPQPGPHPGPQPGPQARYKPNIPRF